VALRDMEAHTLVVKNAYLNARMVKPLYTKQPKGYEVGGVNLVCKCILALYGAQQTGKPWTSEVHGTLTAAGAVRSNAEPNLYL